MALKNRLSKLEQAAAKAGPQKKVFLFFGDESDFKINYPEQMEEISRLEAEGTYFEIINVVAG